MPRVAHIVLASNNRGKLDELTKLLASYAVALHSLAEVTSESPEETGKTFQENALLKARFASRVAGLPAIADDSGIEVDVLGGAPGVHSARYAGTHGDDAANNQKLLEMLKVAPLEQRSARFRCALAYVRHFDDSNPLFADGVWEGSIAFATRGTQGFGYDSVFLPIGSQMTAAEWSPAEKNNVSHRAQALRALMRVLVEHNEVAS